MAVAYNGSCNFTSPLDLISLGRDPDLNLTSLAVACEQVCLLLYSSGNPDLTGVGAVLSYVLQVSLAILHGPILIASRFFVPASRFVGWIEKEQEVNLWSQLLFALCLSLACLVRQYQPKLVYEAAVIFLLVGVNLISFLLSMAAFYQPIKWPTLFSFSVVATYVFSAFAELVTVIKGRYFDRFLRACQEAADPVTQPWSQYTVGPYDPRTTLPVLLSIVGLVLVLNGTWFLARKRSRHRTQYQFRKRSSGEWIVGAAVFLPSVSLAGFAIFLFIQILYIRKGLSLVSEGGTGENVWGMAQVCAPFAWAPLLADMAYSAWDFVRPPAHFRFDLQSSSRDQETYRGREMT